MICSVVGLVRMSQLIRWSLVLRGVSEVGLPGPITPVVPPPFLMSCLTRREPPRPIRRRVWCGSRAPPGAGPGEGAERKPRLPLCEGPADGVRRSRTGSSGDASSGQGFQPVGHVGDEIAFLPAGDLDAVHTGDGAVRHLPPVG